MKPKPTSAAERAGPRFVIVTLDNHLAGAVDRARRTLARDIPGLDLAFHAAADWNDPAALKSCLDSIAKADIIVATMLFMEEHAEAVLPCDPRAARTLATPCSAACRPPRSSSSRASAGSIWTERSAARSTSSSVCAAARKPADTGGEKQLAMLRRIPKILRFIPGAAQDVRAYFLTLQYWLAGSDENVVSLVRFLFNRYAERRPRRPARRAQDAAARSSIRKSASITRAPPIASARRSTRCRARRPRRPSGRSASCSCVRICSPTTRPTTTP